MVSFQSPDLLLIQAEAAADVGSEVSPVAEREKANFWLFQ